ncbi:MAG: ABC transporter permease [Oscillospiraceae bacterium]|jgi:ABC-2 type transport system permease protein|nr:ABC transporter permease [Oscillospiraceae bacterium]
MKQIGTVFRFEFKNYAKSKAYLILTILLVAVVGVALSIPRIQEVFSTGKKEETPEKSVVAVVDQTGTGKAASALSAAVPQGDFRPVSGDLASLKKDVDAGKYSCAVLVGSGPEYTYVVKNVGMYDTLQSRIEGALLTFYRVRALQKVGVPAADSQKLLSGQMRANVVKTAEGKDQMQNFFYTYIVIFALYMAIMLYGQFVASSVATEKSTRAMELLITSTRPRNLMFGKVFGAGTAGILQLALIFGSGYVFYNLNASYYASNPIVQSIFGMPLSILLYALLFFLLGFFLYAFLYAALGSLVSRMEELGQAVMPVTFLFIIAFLIVIFSMSSGNVDNAAMVVCSYIPFTSPMAMFTRIAMGNVAGWQIAVSVVILAASTVGVGFLAAAVYRMGVLLYGKAPKPREIFAMLKNSRQ